MSHAAENKEQITRAELEMLLAANHALVERVKLLEQDNAKLKQKNQELEHQLDWFRRQVHGEKSEKRIISSESLSEQQLHLGGEFEGEQRALDKEIPVKGYVRRKKKELEGSPEDSGLRFDESLVPVETIRLPNPDAQGLRPDEYEVVKERCTYRLAQRQGPFVVLKYVQQVIKLKGSGAVLTPEAPGSVFEGSFADISFMVCLLIDKFVYHLPLYRQHKRLAAAGIVLSRATLTNYVHRVCALLEPIYEALLRQILLSHVLALDETPTKAGRKKKGKLKKGYFWPLYGDSDEVVFIFRESRAGKWLDELLKDFKGTLLTDGYKAYEQFAKRMQEITHAQCWAHARRAIEKAKNTEPVLVEKLLALFAKLWQVETHIREQGLEAEAKRSYRQRHSKAIVADIFTCCQFLAKRRALLPSNPLSKGISYVLKRKESLQVFLDDPGVPLDTNHLERELRPIPMGRKAWLFCWTEIGAHYVAIIQSLLVTCKLHGVNPYVYLIDVLQRIETHPMSEVDKLTPRLWKQHYGDKPLPDSIELARRQGWLKNRCSDCQGEVTKAA